jgi:hypothetical protein
LAFLAFGAEITILADAVIVGGVETLGGDDKEEEDVAIVCEVLGSSAKHHRFVKDPKDISPSNSIASIHSVPALHSGFFVNRGQQIAGSSFARVLRSWHLRQ